MGNELVEKLLGKNSPKRKSVILNLEQDMVDQIDDIVKQLNEYRSTDIVITRQSFLEEIIKGQLESTKKYLNDNAGTLRAGLVGPDFDTVLIPAVYEGFAETFLEKKEWLVKASKSRLGNIKYVAVYVGAPTSAITHYAKVLPNPEYIRKERKYLYHFDGEPIELPTAIPIGKVSSINVRPTRFLKLDDLLKCKNYQDIIQMSKTQEG